MSIHYESSYRVGYTFHRYEDLKIVSVIVFIGTFTKDLLVFLLTPSIDI